MLFISLQSRYSSHQNLSIYHMAHLIGVEYIIGDESLTEKQIPKSLIQLDDELDDNDDLTTVNNRLISSLQFTDREGNPSVNVFWFVHTIMIDSHNQYL